MSERAGVMTTASKIADLERALQQAIADRNSVSVRCQQLAEFILYHEHVAVLEGNSVGWLPSCPPTPTEEHTLEFQDVTEPNSPATLKLGTPVMTTPPARTAVVGEDYSDVEAPVPQEQNLRQPARLHVSPRKSVSADVKKKRGSLDEAWFRENQQENPSPFHWVDLDGSTSDRDHEDPLHNSEVVEVVRRNSAVEAARAPSRAPTPDGSQEKAPNNEAEKVVFRRAGCAFLRIAGLYFAMLLYVAVGGFIVSKIESDAAAEHYQTQLDMYNNADFNGGQHQLLVELGIWPQPELWDWLHAAFYCLTLVSTIGYGYYTTRTPGGQLFTIIYSLLGIPFFAILMARMSTALLDVMNLVLYLIFRKMAPIKVKGGKLIDADRERAALCFAEVDTDGSGSIDKTELGELLSLLNGGQAVPPETIEALFQRADLSGDGTISMEEFERSLVYWVAEMADIQSNRSTSAQLAFASLLLVLLIFLCAGVMSEAEKWSFGKSFWFAVVSVLTIGFGDAFPSTNGGIGFSVIFIMIALSTLAWVIDASLQKVKFREKRGGSLVSFKMRKSGWQLLFRLACMLGVVFAYIAWGGWMLWLFEKEVEGDQIRMVKTRIAAANFTEAQMKLVSGNLDFQLLTERNFDWWGSTFFCLTVISTVGYGSYVPSTSGGKFFTCLYAIPGIMLFLWQQGCTAQLLIALMRKLMRAATKCFRRSAKERFALTMSIVETTFDEIDASRSGKLSQAQVRHLLQVLVSKHNLNDGQPLSPQDLQFVTRRARLSAGNLSTKARLKRAAVVSSVTEFWELLRRKDKDVPVWQNTLLSFFIMAAIIASLAPIWSAIEGYGYREAVYFAFTTLSTVGLGDYTPRKLGGTILDLFMIFFGVASMANFFSCVPSFLWVAVSTIYQRLRTAASGGVARTRLQRPSSAFTVQDEEAEPESPTHH
eukprot:TRINITY_DN512_c0_g1_i1.p1 TRINITY_DN512_c0_g1~~TRINITY_DN512_c0_g1_i1.p1  ORF type:complete len:934 (+),score=128.47 TRINITY_DN512_c0_g1_i1:61-2862(+)